MQTRLLRLRAFAFMAAVAVLASGGWASADPPSRVARLGYLSGAVSFSPAGENDWVQARINRPLTPGDRLWVDAGARAEIQVGAAVVRMNAGTSLDVVNLDDRIVQLQLAQGSLNVRVRRLEPNQVFEVDTPNLAFTLRQPGAYRIEVDPDGSATTIIVRQGKGEVYGEGAAYVIDSRHPYRFTGTDLRQYEGVDAVRLDEFDRWSGDRDRRYDNSVSARYVSPDVVGYQDLDDNGTWRADATYGNVWYPSRVGADWAPYRDGHWAWVDPWGWTWVDDAPWGFAVSHYGRWTNLHGTWGWVPGPVRSRAYYAPALVAFVGGDNFRLTISGGSVGGIAWFPLGPREVYRPSYPVSRAYFENVNRSNTVVSVTTVNNYYNNSNVTNVIYANQAVPNAIVAVPVTAFAQSQPVSRTAVRVTRDMVARAPVAAVAAVAPTETSVRGAANAGGKPPAHALEKPIVARTAPPAASIGFAAQKPQLAQSPGKPLDDAARRQLKPATPVPAPVVRVVSPERKAPPTTALPPAASAGKAPEARTKPAAQPAEQQRGKPEARDKPAAAPPAPAEKPQAAAPARPAPQQAKPAAPAAQPPEQQRGKPAPQQQPPEQQRGKPAPQQQPPEQQRGKPEARERPAAAPPAPAEKPQAAAPARPAPQQAKPAAPAAQPPEQAKPVTPAAQPPQQAKPAAPTAQPPEPRAKPAPQQAPEQQRGKPVAAPPAPAEKQPAPKAEPRGQKPDPSADKPKGKDKDDEEDGKDERKKKN